MHKLELADKLKVRPEWLTALFTIESRNNPAAVNPITGATGLIQFMPKTAALLGTSCAELGRMTYDTQLDWVYKYLSPYKDSFQCFADLYFAVFFPLAIGKPDAWTLEAKNLKASLIAQQNKCYDTNKDGKITVGEVKQVINKYLDHMA